MKREARNEFTDRWLLAYLARLEQPGAEPRRAAADAWLALRPELWRAVRDGARTDPAVVTARRSAP